MKAKIVILVSISVIALAMAGLSIIKEGTSYKHNEDRVKLSLEELLDAYTLSVTNEKNPDTMACFFEEQTGDAWISMAAYEAKRALATGERIQSMSYTINDFSCLFADQYATVSAKLAFEIKFSAIKYAVQREAYIHIVYRLDKEGYQINGFDFTYPLYAAFSQAVDREKESEARLLKATDILQATRNNGIVFGENTNKRMTIAERSFPDYLQLKSEGFDFSSHVPAGLAEGATPFQGAYFVRQEQKYRNKVFYLTDIHGGDYIRSLYSFDLRTKADIRLLNEAANDFILADGKLYIHETDNAYPQSITRMVEIDCKTLDMRPLSFKLEGDYIDKIGDFIYYGSNAGIYRVHIDKGETELFLEEAPIAGNYFIFGLQVYHENGVYVDVLGLDGYENGRILVDYDELHAQYTKYE